MVERLSNLENALTYNVRTFLRTHFSTEKIRQASFCSSLVTCLFDASVVTFSIFTPQFIKHLNYDQIDINIIGGAMNIGLYLTLPALGYLSDAHGPMLLALIGMVLCPGYILAAWCYHAQFTAFIMAIAFFLIGTGTSSAYFCSLLTCAKIYPDRKGLGISLPVTCYGVSSLLLSYIFQLSVFRVDTVDSDSHLSVYKVFIFLSVVYLLTGVVNSISSVIVTIEKETVFEALVSGEQVATAAQQSEITEVSLMNAAERVASYNSVEDTGSLINSDFMEPQSHEVRFAKFLRDPTMPLVYICLFFLAGTEELFVANLGSLTEIVGSKGKKSISDQVALFSIFSTITRLGAGFLNDAFGTCKATIRLILTSIALCIISYAMVAFNVNDFGIISSLMGICYGSTYTLFPTLVASVWGVDLMGSTWGLFLSAPAFGDLIFGLFYAYEFDRYCVVAKASISNFVYCLTTPFLVFGVLALVSGIFLYYCYRRYWTGRLSN